MKVPVVQIQGGTLEIKPDIDQKRVDVILEHGAVRVRLVLDVDQAQLLRGELVDAIDVVKGCP